MQLADGGHVVVHVVDGELRVLAQLVSIRKTQEFMRQFKKPGVSVVDEFLAERRAMWGEE